MPKTTNDFQQSNPAFTGRGKAGISPADHSSSEFAGDHIVEADHAQSDDDNNGAGVDPNLTGGCHEETQRGFEMEDTVSWRAGELTAWRDNDDYLKFFMRTETPDSGLVRYNPQLADLDHDGDYDDNGGIPLAHGHYFGSIGAVDSEPLENTGVNAIIVRRV